MKKAYFGIALVVLGVVAGFGSGIAQAGDYDVLLNVEGVSNTRSWGTNSFTIPFKVGVEYKPEANQTVCRVQHTITRTSATLPQSSLILSVYEGGLRPETGALIGSKTIPSTDVPTTLFNYVPFEFEQCLQLKKGNTYWFVWSTPYLQSWAYISQHRTDVYPSTKYWQKDVSVQGWTEYPGREWGFRLEGYNSKEPVIIVPGILGSRLNRVSDGEEVWPNSIEMAKPGSDNYLTDLGLSASGDQISGKEMNATDILEEAWPFTVYGNLVDTFRDRGYEDGKDLFTVAYDWRLSVQDSADVLTDVVQQALENSSTGKVNIIAHSMGGLVTKEYLSRPGASASINNVVLLGVPNLGAPKAFKVLNYGDDFDLSKFGVGLNPQKAKEISQNMPGVYELLPSREYANLKGGYVRDFRNGQNLTFSYDQTNNFMTTDSDLSDHRNSDLLSSADVYHQTIDSASIIGPKVFNIMGCQNPDTIGEIRLYDDGNVDITAVDGDGTVPLTSARANSDNYQNYYALYSQIKVNHSGLVKDVDITKFVADLITETSTSVPSGMSQSVSSCLDALPNPTKIIFSTHSPVSLHVYYDEQNLHTGLNADGDLEALIPGSNFYMIGENSFISVPAGNQYRVVIDALSSGSFDFKMKSYNGSVLSNSAAYLNVLLPSDLFRAEMNFVSVNPDLELYVDNNGDNAIDEVKKPDVELSDSGDEDVIPPVISFAEPLLTTYSRSMVMPFIVSANDSSSGIGLVNKYFDNNLVTGDSVDLFFEKLGSHSLDTVVYDKAGNPVKAYKNIQIIATVQSTITDLERLFSLGWTNGEVKNSLKSLLEASMPTAKTIESKGKKADGVLGTAFLNQLDTEYNKGSINQQAYELLKEDIGWLLK